MSYQIGNGETFSLRVIMSVNNGAIKWANTHEYQANSVLTYDDQLQLATQIAQAMRLILLPPVRIERIVVSSWVPDGRPYNPDTFNVFGFALQGNRTRAQSEPVDLTMCLSYIRVPEGGRQGRMLLRGVLTEDMMVYSAGRYTVQEPANLDGVDFRAAEAQLKSTLVQPLNGSARMVMRSQQFNRPVLSLIRGDVVFKKLRNKYFDRGGSSA